MIAYNNNNSHLPDFFTFEALLCCEGKIGKFNPVFVVDVSRFGKVDGKVRLLKLMLIGRNSNYFMFL